jgi:hypothetical protein
MWSNRGTDPAAAGLPPAVGELPGAEADSDGDADSDAVIEPGADAGPGAEVKADADGGRGMLLAGSSVSPQAELASTTASRTASPVIRAIVAPVSWSDRRSVRDCR